MERTRMMMGRPLRRRSRPSGPSTGRRSGDAGFTLLEVLIATVVLAAGAAVILGHVYQLLDFTQRARGHRDDVRHRLNQVAELSLLGPGSLGQTLQQDHVLLSDLQARPLARLENHPFAGVQVPVSVGFAPLQIFHLPVDGRHSLSLIGRGIKARSGS